MHFYRKYIFKVGSFLNIFLVKSFPMHFYREIIYNAFL